MPATMRLLFMGSVTLGGGGVRLRPGDTSPRAINYFSSMMMRIFRLLGASSLEKGDLFIFQHRVGATSAFYRFADGPYRPYRSFSYGDTHAAHDEPETRYRAAQQLLYRPGLRDNRVNTGPNRSSRRNIDF